MQMNTRLWHVTSFRTGTVVHKAGERFRKETVFGWSEYPIDTYRR